MKTTAILLTTTVTSVSSFSVCPLTQQNTRSSNSIHSTVRSSNTALNGLFDGVKEAFSTPSALDPERETPIDRWMGWSVVSENKTATNTAAPADFVDSMDESNYVGVSLPKPMGIVFEENDSEYGGIFVQSLTEDGVAAKNGSLQPGDQLVAVGTKSVSGLDFDDALGAIIESEDEITNLSFFRGSAKQFYGPTGPSKDWLTAFCEKGGVLASSLPSASSAEEISSS